MAKGRSVALYTNPRGISSLFTKKDAQKQKKIAPAGKTAGMAAAGIALLQRIWYDMREKTHTVETNKDKRKNIKRERMGKDMSILPETIGSLFEMSRDPVMGVGEGHTVVFVNPPAAALLGVGVGGDATAAVPVEILDDPAEQFIATARVGRQPANVSVRRLDGIAVLTWSVPRQTPPGLEPSRALRELADGLMNIRLAIDALVRYTKAEDDPTGSEAASVLYKTYYQLLRLSRHMTLAADIARDQLPSSPRVTDLGKLCQDLCQTVGALFESRGVSVVFHADLGMHLTMADPDQLEIMLLNLLHNSLSHSGKGDMIRVDLSRQGDRFIIAVQDAGAGMDPETLAGIFGGSPAQNTADPTDGAGMGLLIARGIAERHGGTMILESRPGRGTSVRISIPYKASETLKVNARIERYRSDGMNNVLTELSPLLDSTFFTRKMFD